LIFFVPNNIFAWISFIKLVSSIFGENGGKSNQRDYLLKEAFFYGDRHRRLSRPRYRPCESESEVK